MGRYSLAGYQLGLRNGLVVLVGGLAVFLFSPLFGGLVAETTNQTGCSVEWCFGSSQLTNTGQADTEIVVPLSGDSSFINVYKKFSIATLGLSRLHVEPMLGFTSYIMGVSVSMGATNL